MQSVMHHFFSRLALWMIVLSGLLAVNAQYGVVNDEDLPVSPLPRVVPLPDDSAVPVAPLPPVRRAEVIEEVYDPAVPSRQIIRAEVIEDIPQVAVPVYQPGVPVSQDETKVSVLGYHDFSTTKKPTRMMMRTADFRSQMQRIRDSGTKVISMGEFIEWAEGRLQLPPHCVLITLDDGWKAVYDEAFPILKEYGYPFTLFLYTNYIDRGGASMTWAMIKEMISNGASIGSHSKSHPDPATLRKERRAGEEGYLAFLKVEMGESKKILEEKLGVKVLTYCYPGGNKTPEMAVVLKELGYVAAFDVLPGKVTTKSSLMEVPRYMVLGDELRTFNGALAFGETQSGATFSDSSLTGPVPSHMVTPAANASVPLNLDPISINLARAGNIDPSSITMKVSGMGLVPGMFDSRTNTYSWKPNRLLRGTVTVRVSWAMMGSKKQEAPVEWQFKTTEYLSEPPPKGWIP